ncbi:hypothetical protein C8R44DRAFT_737845 [Mycena epipterygia]|nr:hypothetical protein C8R44DRAFT_737845 [Mycena epipterygia]
MDSLPNELLREIFLLVSTTEGSYSDSPFKLAGICSLWRNLALDFPELWVSIRCDLLFKFNWARVEFFLERSRGLPLELSLSESQTPGSRRHSPETVFNPRLPLVQKIFHSSANRWRSADISLNGYPVDILHPLYRHLDTLENLCITFSGVPGEISKLSLLCPGTTTRINDIFAEAPLLKRVHLTAFNPRHSALFQFAWDRLTHVTLILPSVKSCRVSSTNWNEPYVLNALRDAVKLEYFKLKDYAGMTSEPPRDDFDPDARAPIALGSRCLTSLETCHIILLNNLSIPPLRELVLHEDQRLRIRPRISLSSTATSFVHRSGCTLTSLTIVQACFVPEEHLRTLFSALVSLETLHLDYRYQQILSEQIVPTFEVLSGVLPSLLHLTLTLAPQRLATETCHSITDIVRSRTSPWTLDLKIFTLAPDLENSEDEDEDLDGDEDSDDESEYIQRETCLAAYRDHGILEALQDSREGGVDVKFTTSIHATSIFASPTLRVIASFIS